jgi:uncharacterized protein (DUF2141 family)
MMRLALLMLLAAPAAAETLDVRIEPAAGASGRLVVALFAGAPGFSGFDMARAAAVQTLAAGQLTARFEGLAPGRYAVVAFQDADGDGRLKTNFIGMPKEPVGTSNNPGGLPKFDKSAVMVPGADPVVIRLRKVG